MLPPVEDHRMTSIFRRILVVCALAGAAFADAADMTFTVTRTDDPAPDGCSIGDCSLREAVLAANANSGAINSIMLDAATYAVGAPRLDALGNLRLLGKGSAQTSIIETGGVTTLAHSGEYLLVQGVTLDTTTTAELFTELFAGGDRTALIDGSNRARRSNRPDTLTTIRLPPQRPCESFADAC